MPSELVRGERWLLRVTGDGVPSGLIGTANASAQCRSEALPPQGPDEGATVTHLPDRLQRSVPTALGAVGPRQRRAQDRQGAGQPRRPGRPRPRGRRGAGSKDRARQLLSEVLSSAAVTDARSTGPGQPGAARPCGASRTCLAPRALPVLPGSLGACRRSSRRETSPSVDPAASTGPEARSGRSVAPAVQALVETAPGCGTREHGPGAGGAARGARARLRRPGRRLTGGSSPRPEAASPHVLPVQSALHVAARTRGLQAVDGRTSGCTSERGSPRRRSGRATSASTASGRSTRARSRR
jgi:hypothetical protein